MTYEVPTYLNLLRVALLLSHCVMTGETAPLMLKSVEKKEAKSGPTRLRFALIILSLQRLIYDQPKQKYDDKQI